MNEQRHHTMRFAASSQKQIRACARKTRYPSKRNAAATARARGDGMNAYRCPMCRKWHVGHGRGHAA
jgi:hypothetical protein